MAKFDIKTEAKRPLYAGVGVTDLAVEAVRDYVADVQKRFAGVQKSVTHLDLQPQALREQAVIVVSSRVDALSKDAKARRAAIEARVADLQAEAKELPVRVQSLLNDNVATVNSAYADLAKRGETLVGRIRKQESTKATTSAAKATTVKAKTTKTQAKKTTKTAAKKATTGAKSTAKKTTTAAKKAPATRSAKATTTAATTTASNAASAVADAAEKVGD